MAQICKSQQTQEKPGVKDEVVQFAESIGLPTEEGIFGFKPFAEVWVGRLAMAGFLSAIIGEFITGKGPLGQIGLITPSPPLLVTLSAALTSATFVALVQTLVKAQKGDLSPRDAARYSQFLGIAGEDKNIEESASGLKNRGDPVTNTLAPDSRQESQEIGDSKAQGTPADRALNLQDRSEAASKQKMSDEEKQKYRAAGPSMSIAQRNDELERQNFANEPTLRYARKVEITNGRWAMLGFAVAILVEAATGKGILSQVLFWFKVVGLLGKDSGF